MYLLPITRSELAELMGMHESTVSRALKDKYVQLPNGRVVSFDVFFDRSVKVGAAIEDLLRNESACHRYTDKELVDLLSTRGINVSRRCVGKYRNKYRIVSSILRR